MKSSSNIREVIAFLQQLQVHNDRAWFKAHKDEYEAVRKPWEADMERLISLVSQFDGNVRGLDLKGCVHFQPDNIMLGGGVWWPQKPILDKLRALIDAEPDEFLKIVTAPEFTSRFHWESDALKTMPKDYPREHPLSQYLKMKEYIVMMRPGLDYFDCDDWVERVAADLHHLQPLHDFLNYVFE